MPPRQKPMIKQRQPHQPKRYRDNSAPKELAIVNNAVNLLFPFFIDVPPQKKNEGLFY